MIQPDYRDYSFGLDPRIERFRKYYHALRSAFPDIHFDIALLVAEDDVGGTLVV